MATRTFTYDENQHTAITYVGLILFSFLDAHQNNYARCFNITALNMCYRLSKISIIKKKKIRTVEKGISVITTTKEISALQNISKISFFTN